MEEESKQNKSNDTNEDEEDDINNINKEPSPFAPSDLSIEGFDCSLTSHRNKIILREKVVLLGNAAVGKSSLVQSFISSVTENINNKHYLMTAGVNLNVKQVPIPNSNITVDLFLYDTGGQGIFNKREKSSSFWTNCSYVICIFDVTSRKTLQSCETWMKAIRSSQKQYGSVNVVDSIQSIILVANKIDLREGSGGIIEVDREEGMNFAKEHNMEYFECSTLRSITVDAPFMHIASQSALQYQEEQRRNNNWEETLY